MSGAVVCRYSGRDFTTDDMAILHALLASDPPPNRKRLSKLFCQRVGWVMAASRTCRPALPCWPCIVTA